MQKRERLLRLSLIFCLAALLVSLVFNLFIFLQARHYYIQLNQTNLDPLGLGTFRANSGSDDVPDASTKTVVFFGDSRAAQWPAPAFINGFSFINRGIGNQSSAQVLGRFDQHILPLHPNIIILQVGINDLKTIPLFPKRKDAIVSNCEANIQQVVTRSIKTGATVILTTIFPIGPVPLIRQPFWSPDVAKAVEEVNAYLYSLKTRNVLILDAYSLLEDKGRVQDDYVYDTLHINARGYKELNRELIQVLSTYFNPLNGGLKSSLRTEF